MNLTDLTAKQARVLAFIRARLVAGESAPSLREISEYLGLAQHSSAQSYVDALVRKGLLERLPQHRGLRLGPALLDDSGDDSTATGRTAAPPAAASLPLIGRVAAGSPILAVENVESQQAIDPALFRPRADFLLRVQGLSMRDEGILDGDLIAVHRQPDARSGQIVVARIGDEVTVKRYQPFAGSIVLHPANPDFQPIRINSSQDIDFAIEGICVGVLRRFS